MIEHQRSGRIPPQESSQDDIQFATDMLLAEVSLISANSVNLLDELERTETVQIGEGLKMVAIGITDNISQLQGKLNDQTIEIPINAISEKFQTRGIDAYRTNFINELHRILSQDFLPGEGSFPIVTGIDTQVMYTESIFPGMHVETTYHNSSPANLRLIGTDVPHLTE